MAIQMFTVICDFNGGTYVSQFEGDNPERIARQWAPMMQSERPIPRSSTHIAKNLIRDLHDGFLPSPLDGLTNVWQSGTKVGRDYFTVTFVRSS